MSRRRPSSSTQPSTNPTEKRSPGVTPGRMLRVEELEQIVSGEDGEVPTLAEFRDAVEVLKAAMSNGVRRDEQPRPTFKKKLELANLLGAALRGESEGAR